MTRYKYFTYRSRLADNEERRSLAGDVAEVRGVASRLACSHEPQPGRLVPPMSPVVPEVHQIGTRLPSFGTGAEARAMTTWRPFVALIS